MNLHTRPGFGEFTYDNFVEVMNRYKDLAAFWIDNDNEFLGAERAVRADPGTAAGDDAVRGGGYMYGGLKPGDWNDGAHGVTTVSNANPDVHYINVLTKPATATSLVVGDNDYRVTRVTDLRTGAPCAFHQHDGQLTTPYDYTSTRTPSRSTIRSRTPRIWTRSP